MKHTAPRSKWIKFGLPLLSVAVVAAIAGGVVGSKQNNAYVPIVDSNAVAFTSTLSSSSSSITQSSASSAPAPPVLSSTMTSNVAPAIPTPAAPVILAALPTWIWGTDKAIGVCLGNWLVLERWMSEDWFLSLAPHGWDEWDFTQSLGPTRAAAALTDHFNSFITEADIEKMFQNGINHLRIPVGYWAWIPTTGDEPYVNANQTQQIERILAMLYARGMYAVIDLHGLPGSQNGEQHSGHNTTMPSWFDNPTNQARSDTLVASVLTWLAATPHRSVVSALAVINEPRPYTPAQNAQLLAYYTRSYDAIQKSSYPVAMIFSDAFLPDPLIYWLSFAIARVTTPPSLVFEDHPYPGSFPLQTGQDSILSQICVAANKYLNFPVPVAITEYTLYTGITSRQFAKQFYAAQLSAWSWSAGAFFWSYKVIPSVRQTADGFNYNGWSFDYITNTNAVPSPGSLGVSNTTTRSNARTYLAGLVSNCGSVPINTAPFNDGSITSTP